MVPVLPIWCPGIKSKALSWALLRNPRESEKALQLLTNLTFGHLASASASSWGTWILGTIEFGAFWKFAAFKEFLEESFKNAHIIFL